jgi:hypothetical protein
VTNSVRRALLVVAAIFGALQISIVIGYFLIDAFSSPWLPVYWKISFLLLLPAATMGVVAAVLPSDSKYSRISAAVAAGFTALSVLVPLVFRTIENLNYDIQLSEMLNYLRQDLLLEIGFGPANQFLYQWHKWIEILGTIALILWIVCAVFPAKKIKAGVRGAHSARMPSSFPINETLANPVPPVSPAPMVPPPIATPPISPAPVVPPAMHGAKFCTNCGKQLAESGKFCTGCGTPT